MPTKQIIDEAQSYSEKIKLITPILKDIALQKYLIRTIGKI